MKSIFTDKHTEPTAEDLKEALKQTYPLWLQLSDHTLYLWPGATTAWKHSGDKYGWSFRISDKKRVLLYLLPRDGFFKAAMVFGQKATDTILAGSVSGAVKDELSAAKAYAEGRGIRLEVRDNTIVADIEELLRIKIKG